MLTRRSLFGLLAGAVAFIAAGPRLALAKLRPLPEIRPLFWGPKMTEAIQLARVLGINPGPMLPCLFACEMDRLTGTKHPSRGLPEECAALWLPELRRLAREQGWAAC